jgi:hypothetical protein
MLLKRLYRCDAMLNFQESISSLLIFKMLIIVFDIIFTLLIESSGSGVLSLMTFRHMLISFLLGHDA